MDEDREKTEGSGGKQKTKKRNKISIEWPFEISLDLHPHEKQRIAFGSGKEREYYPEKPGYSKIAQVFVASSFKGDTPNPSYFPPSIGITKPISTFGYGIGHLLSKRFPDLQYHEKRPGPGSYDLAHYRSPRPHPNDLTNPVIQLQRRCAFGSSLRIPRFQEDLDMKPPGPGTYSVSGTGQFCTKLKSKGAFGTKACITPTTVTICAPRQGETCSECGVEQRFDYYRTKTKVKVHGNEHCKPKTVVLCRNCYCSAWNGHHKYWTRKMLLLSFQKSRHCSYHHEHRNLSLIINKAKVKDIKKLTTKECILAKYFSDHCHPELKNQH